MDNSERSIRGLALRLIEALLKLYPVRFRQEFHPEIQAVILSRLREAEQSGLWPAGVVREIAGLVPSIIQERWHDLRFRKETFMMIANEKPGRFFYIGWIALNVSGVIMAWFIAWAILAPVIEIVGNRIQGDEDSLFLPMLFPIIGLLTGALQYILLRRYLPHMLGWIAATFLGWLTPFGIGFMVTRLFIPGNSTLWIMIGMFIFGAAIAVPQWWLLRKRVRHAGWWVLSFGLGWGMVGLLSLVTSDPWPVLLGIAVVPSIATSLACWLLLDRLPNQEFASRTPGL